MSDELVICEGWSPDQSPTSDASVLWQLLFYARKSPVSIIDIDGRFLAANDLINQDFGVAPATLVGRNMAEFLPPDIFEERIEIIRRVALSRRAENVTGATWGVKAQCAFRPLPTPPGGVPRVLHVLGFADRDPHGVPTTRLLRDDLGQLRDLTGREREVLALIGAGLSTAEIATRLHRSVKTIEWHRASLGTKLNASNRVELAQIAIRLGLVRDLETVRVHGAAEGG